MHPFEAQLLCLPEDGRKWRIAVDPAADLILPVAKEDLCTVSAEITWSDDGFHLRDLSSEAGLVRVNQRGWLEGILDPQCVIWFGENRFFWNQGQLASAPAKGYLEIRDMGIIRVKRTREKRTILRHLDFQLKHDANRGAMTAVFGPSGCGKSSLIRAILGEITPSQGRIIRHPECVIGYIPQDDILPVYRTVCECLVEAIIYRDPLATITEAKDKARTLATMLEIHNRFDDYVKELSGGERKRVSVAMELAGDPDILILDEPTTGLDPKSQKNVMDKLAYVAKVRDITVICVTHALETINYFDQIVILRALDNEHDEKESSLLFAAPFRRGGGSDGTISKICSDFGINQLSDIFGLTETYAPINHMQSGDSGEPASISDNNNSLLKINWRMAARHTLLTFLRSSSQLYRNRTSLTITLALPIIIGLLIFMAEGRPEPTDVRDGRPGLFLHTGVAAIWLGMSLVVRTIVSEKKNYQRNLRAGLLPFGYLSGKILFLAAGAAFQCAILALTLILANIVGICGLELRAPWPQAMLVSSYTILLFLTMIAGGFIGLAISAWARSEYVAVSCLPLLLIPHLLFNMSSYQASPIYRSDGPYNPIFQTTAKEKDARIKATPHSSDYTLHRTLSLPLITRPHLNILEGRIAAIQREKLEDPTSNAIAHPSQSYINKHKTAFRLEWFYFLALLVLYCLVMIITFRICLPTRTSFVDHD